MNMAPLLLQLSLSHVQETLLTEPVEAVVEDRG
jgi:hypothetical protein